MARSTAMLLKGAAIGSGSIVGGAAVVAGKTVPSNTSWAGNPARQIARGIFFDGACVHGWTAEQTAASQTFTSDKWVYANAPAARSVGSRAASKSTGRSCRCEGAYRSRAKCLRGQGEEPLRHCRGGDFISIWKSRLIVQGL